MENKAINIGSRREVFWDNFIVDEKLTTASLEVNRLEYVGDVIEDSKCGSMGYPCIVKDEKGYKMYYISKKPNFSQEDDINVDAKIIESTDGVNWTIPSLGLFEESGSKDNNIVYSDFIDNFFVMLDSNPDCLPEEKYKAVGINYEMENDKLMRGLWYYTSEDGYHFTRRDVITYEGLFDTMNTLVWTGSEYKVYTRNYHDIPAKGYEDGVTYVMDHPGWHILNKGVRDIRVLSSKDLKNWTRPVRIKFDDEMDFPLYTNNVSLYERAPHMYIGFATRYNEKKEWENIDEMPSGPFKRNRAKDGERLGLAVTDCIFMCSRDGENWHKFNEAFASPTYEHKANWVYGDCYLGYNFLKEDEENYYMCGTAKTTNPDIPSKITLNKIRKDGFAYREADADGAIVVTKPIVFEGKYLHINFESSAYGSIFVDLLDKDGNVLNTSYEIFGNNIDRKVYFKDGTDFSGYSGKEVRLRFRMVDAKIYSMKFE